MKSDWMDKNFEGPTTEVFVGLTIQDVRRTAVGKAEIGMIRELGPNGAYTLEYRENRLTLLVVDGVVVAASMC